MEKLIVSAAVLCALGSIYGCAGDTSDEEPDQTQQAVNGVGTGTNRGGVASSGVENGNTPKGNTNTHRPPQTQAAFDDPTQQVEGR